MTFAAVGGAPLWSGYAPLRTAPPMASHDNNRQRLHLTKAKQCLDEAGHLCEHGPEPAVERLDAPEQIA